MAEDVLCFDRVIVCEGPDDLLFLKTLISTRKMPSFHLHHTGVQKTEKGGITKFCGALQGISARRGFSGVKNVILVADADEDRDANFALIRDQVAKAGFEPPGQANMPSAGKPKIWIIILPFEGQGTLESYCIEAAKSVNAELAKSSDHFRDLVTKDAWPIPKSDKLWLRAMLAGHCIRDPMVHFGTAVSDPKYGKPVPTEHKSFNGLARILEKCCEPGD